MNDRHTFVFLPCSQFGVDIVELRKEDEHYLRRVLRKRSGQDFVALDGEGRAWRCLLSSDSQAKRVEDFPAVPPLRLTLKVGLSLCKGSRFEGAIEKLAELGVSEVHPISTQRTERKEPSHAKLERFREIAISASALAQRLIPLRVAQPTSLRELVENSCEEICYCQPGGLHPTSFFAKKRESLLLLIGPEGGFSPAELATLEQRAQSVDLGPLNLRVETAAVAAASLALNLQVDNDPDCTQRNVRPE